MASEQTGLSGLAGRYAAALLELADERKALDEIANDLGSLKQMLADSEDLRRLVRSPMVSRTDQGRAMDAIAEQAGFHEMTRNFLGLLAKNRRLFAIGDVIDGFLNELARRRGEMQADVTSAQALSDEQLAQITDTLRKALGSKVTVNTAIDPSLIGGLVVKVGSRMIDTSVRSKLTRLKLAMKGVG